ncbi:MAG: hypothetical protein PVH87_22945 [Desulfobacteraceae bacterium]|jgi:hypothetical protein
METNPITKQVLDFQKGAFSSWYSAMSILQEQAALTVDTLLNQAGWIPDEGRRAMLSWVSACKNEGERYKAYMEESFSGLEKYLAQEIKAAPVKSKKPVVETKKAASAKTEKPAAEEKKAVSAKETK